MDFSGLQQFFFSPLRNVSHSPAPSSGIQVQLACTLGPQTPCHGCHGVLQWAPDPGSAHTMLSASSPSDLWPAPFSSCGTSVSGLELGARGVAAVAPSRGRDTEP